MTKEEERAEKERGGLNCYRLAVSCFLFFLLALFLFALAPMAFWIPQTLWGFTTGWAFFLWQNLPKAKFDADILLMALFCCAAASGLLQYFAAWVTRSLGKETPWRFRWTAFVTILLVLMFATAVCMAGLVHQVVWLFSAPITDDSGLERSREKMRRAFDRNNAEFYFIEFLSEVDAMTRDEEIQAIWKKEPFENDRLKFRSGNIKTPRRLWIHRDLEGRLSALLLVPKSWNETMTNDVFLVRVGPQGVMPMETIPGSEIVQWIARRKVLE